MGTRTYQDQDRDWILTGYRIPDNGCCSAVATTASHTVPRLKVGKKSPDKKAPKLPELRHSGASSTTQRQGLRSSTRVSGPSNTLTSSEQVEIMSAAWYYDGCEDESFDYEYEPTTPPLNATSPGKLPAFQAQNLSVALLSRPSIDYLAGARATRARSV